MSTHQNDYELVDFGGGRKLERFDGVLVDRPCPAARNRRTDETLWAPAAIRYDDGASAGAPWALRGVTEPELDDWRYSHEGPFEMSLALAPLPSGQVGMFPEQRDNWLWIFEQCAAAQRRLRVLNLFAYTGASTIAAAAGGAEVTHVDAAKGIVERASQNAVLSGLADASIRWIVDDALKFCAREVRRQNHYDAVILDPPTYGHGKRGESWQFKRDLPELLRLMLELTNHAPAFFLLTCHTNGIDADRLKSYLSDAGLKGDSRKLGRGEMQLCGKYNRKLAAGVYVRWNAEGGVLQNDG